MRWVQYLASGSVTFDLPARTTGAGTAAVVSSAGAVLASPTPTLDAVNTTLSASAAAGATSLSVTSATGITAGRRYLVGGAETAGGEVVLVASVSGTTVTLQRALVSARASGATFQGTRVTVPVSSACTAEVVRQRRVEWTDPDTAEVLAVPFDVTRYAPRTFLTTSLLMDLDALLRKRIPAGTSLPTVIERAWEMLLSDLATKDRHPGGYAGVIDLTTAHAYLVRSLLAETDTSAEGVEYRDDMRRRYADERDRVLASMGYDAAGDGDAVPGASMRRGIPIVRA